jgi:hypothetical protein
MLVLIGVTEITILIAHGNGIAYFWNYSKAPTIVFTCR